MRLLPPGEQVKALMGEVTITSLSLEARKRRKKERTQ